jgi:hypothetical protein
MNHLEALALMQLQGMRYSAAISLIRDTTSSGGDAAVADDDRHLVARRLATDVLQRGRDPIAASRSDA